MQTFWITALAVAVAVIGDIGAVHSAGFDGAWRADGVNVIGRGCAHWFLLLNVAQGKASGTVTVGNGTLHLDNLVLRADGTFTADARRGQREFFEGHISGQLMGGTITASYETPSCGIREAKGTHVAQ